MPSQPEVHKGVVVVLAGGLSHEREISLRSGARVAQALRDRGREVIEADVNAGLIALLQSLDAPVVFPLLHGGVGEDGGVQQVLELLGVPYVGSDPSASRRTFNKAICGPLLARAGLSTPTKDALPKDVFRELGAEALMDRLGEQIGYPMIVKPARCGSALGVTKVTDASGLAAAMVGAYSYGDVAVIERFIDGTEVAVPVIDMADGLTALPPVEIRPNSGVYDYNARYTPGATRFITPADLPASVSAACQDAAVRAAEVLGLRDLCRADIIVDASGTPYILELGTAPGMTSTSVVPLAVQAAGGDFGAVCAHLVDVAAARG